LESGNENLVIRGSEQIQVCNMLRFVPGLNKSVADSSLKRLVDQEPHAGS
jgi:hypothetical protein